MSDELSEDELKEILDKVEETTAIRAVLRKLTEEEIGQLRSVLARVIPVARAAMRQHLDSIEKAVRDGTLEQFVEQLRGKCAKCGQPPVMHVTEVSSGTGEATSFHLCDEHAGEYRDKHPPRTQQP